jgi:hypothetical protein
VITVIFKIKFAMDVDRQYSLVKALDGDTDKPKQFFLNSGSTGSALEHSVPEQLWSTPDNPAYGISAVKALKIANDQGIPIYTINQNNIDTILPQLQIDTDAKTDIRNAVNAGKEVTVSKTNITYNGWTGCGYIIIDPDTGSGAYMISGGMSGGWMLVVGTFLLVLSGFFLLLTIPLLSAAAPILIAGFFSLITAFLATASASIIFLYGPEKGRVFIKCFYDIKSMFSVLSLISKRITIFLGGLGNLLDGIISYTTVIKFGLCLRRAIETL